MDYLRDAIRDQKEVNIKQANSDLDSNRAAFFTLLSRPSLDRTQAAFLIANIPVDANEELLYRDKKELLQKIRMLIEESDAEENLAVEWLCWALNHQELLLGRERDKDRITQVLLAFDRRSDQKDQEIKSLRAEAKPKTPYLLAIAGLLELLLDKKRPSYLQGTAAEAIGARGWKGASDRQINGLFVEAKAAAKHAESVAQAKIEAREIAVQKTAKS